VIFTGASAKNSPIDSRRICEGPRLAGLKLDQDGTSRWWREEKAQISTDDSTLNAWVIPDR